MLVFYICKRKTPLWITVVSITLTACVYWYIFCFDFGLQYGINLSNTVYHKFSLPPRRMESMAIPKLPEKILHHHIALTKIETLRNISAIFYNRVPKCGSATTSELMRKVAIQKHIIRFSSHINFERYIPEREQKKIVRLFKKVHRRWIYMRHVHFINFTQFGEKIPICLNLVRHPVDRFISRFNFGGYVTHSPDLSINDCIRYTHPLCSDVNIENETLVLVPFFCGQEEFCNYPTSKALTRAKINVIKYYTVIGILDEYHLFLKVLECLLPGYFSGIYDEYVNEPIYYNKANEADEVVNVHNRRTLEKVLYFDIHFYKFLRERFYNLVYKLKLRADICDLGID